MPKLSLLSSTDLVAHFNHRHVSHSHSTNTQLINEIKSAQLDGSELHLLTADSQSAGRGQRGRSWQSPKGNVYLTLYHPMRVPLTGMMSLIAGYELALMPAIRALNTQRLEQGLPPIGVKWANDLGFYDGKKNSGQWPVKSEGNAAQFSPLPLMTFNKLAGILIEPVWQSGALLGCVMGVGLNVMTTPLLTSPMLEGMSYQAISLMDLWRHTEDQPLPTLMVLYEQIAQALLQAHHRFETIMQSPTRIDEFLLLFSQIDALVDRRIQVSRQIQNIEEVLTGTASGIDRHGCLQLRQDDDTLTALFTGRIDVIDSPSNL